MEEGSAGEVSVQVDLYTHPGTGEHKVTVKGKLPPNLDRRVNSWTRDDSHSRLSHLPHQVERFTQTAIYIHTQDILLDIPETRKQETAVIRQASGPNALLRPPVA